MDPTTSDPTTPERRFSPHRFSDVRQLADVRAEFTAWLSSSAHPPEERVGEVAVVLSELGANAIEATPNERPPPHVAAWLERRRCTVEVVNHLAPDEVDSAAWNLDDPLRTGGRGLMLVAAFSDDVEVHADGDRVIVRCTADLSDRS